MTHGAQGVLFDLLKAFGDSSSAISDLRLEWASPVTSLSATFVSSSNTFSFTSCDIDPSNGIEYGYICNSEVIFVLRMTPISSQIKYLEEACHFEEAICLYNICINNPQLREVNILRLHENYGLHLFQKGDFENAINNFIKAEVDPLKIIAKFPDMVPTIFHGTLGISQNSSIMGSTRASMNNSNRSSTRMSIGGTKIGDAVVQKAAASLVQFCEYHRNLVSITFDVYSIIVGLMFVIS